MSSLAEILPSGADPYKPRRSTQQPGWRTRLSEAVQARRSVSLSSGEAAAIVRILEQFDADPFKGGPSDFLSAGDLAIVRLTRTDGSAPDEEHEDGTERQPAASGLIGVENAITAPAATPGGHEDIPASVISTLEVLHSDDTAQPITSIPAPAAPAAPARPARPAPAATSDDEGPIPSAVPAPALSAEDEAAVLENDREAAIQRTLTERFGGARAAASVQEARQHAAENPGDVNPVDFVRKYRKAKAKTVQPLAEGRRGEAPARRRPMGGSNVLDVGTAPAASSGRVEKAVAAASALGFDDPGDRPRV